MYRRLLLFAFFSGLSALVYEIAWVRVLSVVFGSTTYSISSVLAIFMAGIAIGNRVFGNRIDHSPRPLRTYAMIEFGLASLAIVFALSIPWLHSSLAVAQTYVPARTGWIVRIVLGSMLLLPPTILMGATLPVLSRCFAISETRAVDRAANGVVRFVSRMYGLNTLGAVSGCLLAAFLFVPLLGVRLSIFAAAGVNCVIGLTAWWESDALTVSVDDLELDHSSISSHIAEPVPASRRSRPIVFAFVSGFVVLAAEVVWTRLLINQLSGNVLVFAVILAAFLAGMGMAGLAVGRLYRTTNANHGLAILLMVNGAWLIASVAAQDRLAQLFNWIHRTGFEQPETTTLTCLAALFCVLLPATTSLGCVCPWLLATETDARHNSRVGHVVGRLLSWNTIGAIAGSLVAGFGMISSVGATQSLILLATICFVTAAFAYRLNFAVATVGAILCAVLFRSVMIETNPALWFNAGFTRVVQLPADETLFFAEGAEGTVAVTSNDEALRLLVNGVVVADSSREDMWDLLLKAHLPMLLHPAPKRIAVVGLGAGISLGAIESYADVVSIDCIELCPEVVDAHQLFGSFNGRCWEDHRLSLHINDGRHFLLTTSEMYDVINVDPIDPPVCNQYTQDFVQVCHNRLNDGGLMVQWIPLFHLNEGHLRSMAASFVNVFPNTSLWYDGTSILLTGRKGEPLTVDLGRLVDRGRRDRVRENLAVIGRPDPLIFAGTFVCGSAKVREWVRDAIPNTDDRPWLEYKILLSGPLHREAFLRNLKSIRELHEDNSAAPFSGPTDLLSDAKNVRSALLRLLDARIAKFESDHEAADRIIQSIINDFGLSEQVLQTLAPLIAE